jgi:hypothetical protein
MVMEQQEMVKVSVEVRSGTARFRVGVQARSLHEALSSVGGRYSRGEVRVVSPIEPESFFARQPSLLEGMVGTEQALQEAA